MLDTKKNITVTGSSSINGVKAIEFKATIDSENPENMSITNWQTNKTLYKENRTVCRADQAEFEDQVYALQDEMIAEKEAVANEG